MPQEINFPSSLDDDNSLYIAVNNLRTQLTGNITDAVTTIPVITTVGYPDVGFITILTGADITQAEAIAYSGTDGLNFLNAERGADGTPALQHSANDNVDLTIVARHHENVKDAIIEIERFIGVSGSENFVPFVGGNVVLPGTLSVQDTLTVSGGATFCFVTVTGTLSVTGLASFDEVILTGNLDMQGNLLQSAGVAAVQDAVPVVVATGLLWFDTDAVGGSPSDPNLPAGGIFAATVSTSSGITLPNNSSIFLPWDVEDLDTGDWFDSSFPTRLTVPSGVTHLQAQAGVQITSNDVGDRNVQISLTTVTGTEVVATQQWLAASGTTIAQTTSKILTVSGGDYLQASAFQASGGTLDTVVAGDYYFSVIASNTRGVPGVNSVNLLKGDFSILPGSGIDIASDSGDNTILISTVSGLSDTRTFFTAPTSGASPTVLNTVVIENGFIKSWAQV